MYHGALPVNAPPLHPFLGTFVDPKTEREFQSESYAKSTRAFLQFSVALASIALIGTNGTRIQAAAVNAVEISTSGV